MRAPILAALLLLAGTALQVSAQGPVRVPAVADTAALPPVYPAPDAAPGSVVSVAVRVPARHGAAAARFAIRPGTRVMLYGPDAGVLDWTGAEAILPLTFSVPRDEAAGVMHIAHVEVQWPDGGRWIVDVQTRVRVRRALELVADTASVHVPRGERSTFGFTVRNSGNAVDTVRLSFHAPPRWLISPPEPLVIAPGERARGAISVQVPGDAFTGETQIIGVTASGLGSQSSASVSLQVANDADAHARWVQMPATVVVGLADAGALDAAPFAIGLNAAGPIGRGVHASVLVRHAEPGYTAPALQRYLSGPSLHAEVRTDHHRISVGDILFGGSPLLGAYAQASGADGSFRLGDVSTSVFAARPHQLDAPEREGHLLTARAQLPAFGGNLGVAAADLDRPYGVGTLTERSRLATASFGAELLEGLNARAEAGFMQLRDADGRTRSGVALDVHSSYRRSGLALEARVRRVPGALATSGSAVDETFVSGAFDLGSGMSVSAWALRNDVALLDGSGSQQDGAALSLRWRNGIASAQLTAHAHETEGTGLITGDSRRRSLSFGGMAPIGPLMLDGTVEVGRAHTRGIEEALRQATARLSYQRGAAWAWIGATHASGLFGSDLTRLDAGAAARTGRFEIDGRAGTYVGSGTASGRLDAWASTTFHVDSRTALIAGIDYSPWNAGDGVRVSLGARRSFGLPLPLRRRATAEGTVFDDRNGNLRRDPGEPPLRGVTIRRAGALATTDERGRFAFYNDQPSRDGLRVDAPSLGAGLMLPPGVPLPATGRVDVPIHRTGSLRLDLFLDTDGDGARTAGERSAPGASIELIDDRGRTRTATTDANGTIEFRALSPGTYGVTAYALRGQATVTARTIEIRIEAAADERLDVPVPFRPMEIRFRTPLPPDTVTTILGAASTNGSAAGRAPSAARHPHASGADADILRVAPDAARTKDAPSAFAAAPVRTDDAVPARLTATRVRPAAQTTPAGVRSRRSFGFGAGAVPLVILALLVLSLVSLRRRRDER